MTCEISEAFSTANRGSSEPTLSLTDFSEITMPFTFPLATKKETWMGQGALFSGGLIPYYGTGSLGLCFGLSAVWLSGGAPCPALATLLDSPKAAEIQKALVLDPSKEHMDWAVTDAFPAMNFLQKRNYGGNNSATVPSSHVILDLLGITEDRQFIISFWFKESAQSQTAGHAIAVQLGSFGRLIMDPNYGAGTYASNTTLCNDLHRLLASYVHGGGYVEEVVVLEFDCWSEFQ